ncbi:MAG: GAF domain-containing protein [Clostridia bacterium]|nr:GAF domain-containing protein [Clostridia bacterium]
MVPVQGLYYHWYPRVGWLHNFFILYWLAGNLAAMALYWYKFSQADSILEKNQVKYIFGGTMLGILIALTDFLPMYGVKTLPLGTLANVFFLAAVGYAITRYHLMGIAILLRKSLLYSIFAALVSGLYLTVFLLVGILVEKYWPWEFGVAPVFSVLLITTMAHPLWIRMQALVNRLFNREEYQYGKLLKDFANSLVTILDLHELNRIIVSTLGETMGLERGLMILPDRSSGNYKVAAHYGYNRELHELILTPAHPFISNLAEKSGIVWAAEIDAGNELALNLRTAMVLPLKTKNKLVGIIMLGEKKNGQDFTNDDLELLTILVNQAAIALENAVLYEELQELHGYTRRILTGMSSGVMVVNLYGIITYFNRRAEEMTGLSAGEVTGKYYDAEIPSSLSYLVTKTLQSCA